MSSKTEITKIEYERPWDISEYRVTYIDDGKEYTEVEFDANRSKLEQYMKSNGKTYDVFVYLIILLIVIFQIVFPIICLILLIKEIKKNKRENENAKR